MTSWMHRTRPWWRRIGDAASRLGNTLIGGSPAESVSGRAHREAMAGSEPWARAERWIDAAFRLLGEQEHCRRAHERDLEMLRYLVRHAHASRYLSNRRLRLVTERIAEIGKILGGMMKRHQGTRP